MTFRLSTFASFTSVARTALVATALAGIALPAAAQNMLPGLWEMNSKMQSASGNLETAMGALAAMQANMAPEQRRKVEEMMAQRGITLSGGSGGNVLLKMCMTRAMVDQNALPLQQHGDCNTTRSPVKGNTMQVAFTCTKPASSGQGQVTFEGDKAYRLNMKITSSATGNPETVNLDGSGRWLGTQCGSVKPPQG